MNDQNLKEEYPLELGFLLEVPVYDDHRRAKNWCATVTVDPKSPGGLARQFHDRGRGKYYYDTKNMSEGDVLEVAADYYSSSGKKNPCRRYFVVDQILPEKLVLIPVSSEAEGRKLVQDCRPPEVREIVQDLLNRLKDLKIKSDEFTTAKNALQDLAKSL